MVHARPHVGKAKMRLKNIQGVQTLSGQSNLLVSPTKHWSTLDILDSI